MQQLIKILITAIALVIAIIPHAQETVSFTPKDLELLRRLACQENSGAWEIEPSFPETSVINNLYLSQQQMHSAYTEAVLIQIQSDLPTATKIKEFCDQLN